VGDIGPGVVDTDAFWPNALGDIDGDGLADFALVGTGDQPGRYAHVFYGRRAHLAGTIDPLVAADAHLALPGETSLLPVGDIDGDGVDEVAMHVDRSSDLRILYTSTTRLAGDVGIESLRTTKIIGDGLSQGLVGLDGVAAASKPITGLGDLDGDGFGDFAVWGSQPYGQHIFYGRAGGFPAELEISTADATLLATLDPVAPVTQIASGDVTGDGTIDLVMTDAGFNDDDGAVFVLAGDQSRLGGMIDPSLWPTVYVGSRQRYENCSTVYETEWNCIGHEHVGVRLGVQDMLGEGHPQLIVNAPSYWDTSFGMDGRYGFLSQAYIASGTPTP
jgi:hypothetical protein